MTLRSRAAQVRPGPTTWVLAVLALAAFFASAGLAFSSDEPISGASLATVPGVVPDLPALLEYPVNLQGPLLPLDLLPAAPFGPEDKGGTHVDMGAGRPSRLTERETALLQLSRAAVEASRAAGTLLMPLVEVIAPPVSPEEASRMKLAALATAPMAVPTPGTGAPSDFIGPMQAPATERGK